MSAQKRRALPSPQAVAFLAIACCAVFIGGARGSARSLHASRNVHEPLVFPRDHGLHRGERAEWWLLSGYLRAHDGRRFAYHLSFFRFALGARAQLYAAQFAVLDERSGRTVSAERSVRRRPTPNATLPGVLALSIDDWRLAGRPLRDPRFESIDVRAGDHRDGIALSLLPQKPPSPSPAYDGYAFTRMRAHGSVTYGRRRYTVDGPAWLDHEYERAPARASRVGWERFEFQFDDGRDVELFASRLANERFGVRLPGGREVEASSEQLADGPGVPVTGMLVERNGAVVALGLGAVMLANRGATVWHSPHDGATYPALWILSIPPMHLDNEVAVAPTVRDAEVMPDFGGVPIWWGPVDLAQANLPGRALGTGYALLTGYATPTPL